MLTDISQDIWEIIIDAIKEHGYDAIIADIAQVCMETGACDECPLDGKCTKQKETNEQKMRTV